MKTLVFLALGLALPLAAQSLPHVVVPVADDLATVYRTNGQPSMVTTLGYRGINDGGMADYVWVPTNTTPSALVRVAVGGGRWIERDWWTRRWINLRRVGAVGDGRTDDFEAVQTAMNLAAQMDNRLGDEATIYGPAGDYRIEGGSVASPLAGLTFEVVQSRTNCGVRLPLVGPLMLGGGRVLLDHVYFPTVRVTGGTRGAGVVWATNTVLRPGDIIQDLTGEGVWQDRWSGEPAVNFFPDPELDGTNWIKSWSANIAGLAPTNTPGAWGNRALAVFPARPFASGSGVLVGRAGFEPLAPVAALTNQYLLLAAWVHVPNVPMWRPTGFQVAAPGAGYRDGPALVPRQGRPVEVMLATTNGAITGAGWRWRAYLTNEPGPLDVIQDGATGGQLTATGWEDLGYAARIGAPNLMLADQSGRPLSHQGRRVPSLGVNTVRLYQNPTAAGFDGWAPVLQWVFIPPGTTALQLVLSEGALTPKVLTGEECFLVDRLRLLALPADRPNWTEALNGPVVNARP
ncbi:MAG: glycoside hydrolase family 55 protein [Armatimonadetes bacterium]|nr:glycoside hydrolase family 55 protein [Armatimonadota bacterium]